MRKRKPYLKKNGAFVRGTVVKPKYFKEKMVVDLDFDTKTIQDKKTGELGGRSTETKEYERVPILRTEEGLIVGRIPELKGKYPKTYPISTRQKGRTRTRRIPVLHLDHFG